MSRRYCSARKCRNKDTNSNTNKLHFFRFPKEPDRLMVWIKNSGRDDIISKETNYCYDNYRLCSDHFESHMFANLEKNKLLQMAIPTIFHTSKKKISNEAIEKSTSSEKKPKVVIIDDLSETRQKNYMINSSIGSEFTNCTVKEELSDSENIIYIKSDVSETNGSSPENIQLEKTNNCSEYMFEDPNLQNYVCTSSNMMTNSAFNASACTTSAEWIILISSEVSKVAGTNTSTSTIVSMHGTQNLTVPTMFTNTSHLPAIAPLDSSFISQMGMTPPLTMISQQNFTNPTSSMDSALNNQWIILLNSTGPNTSVTNTLSTTVVSGAEKSMFTIDNANNYIQNSVPTMSALPSIQPAIPIVSSILNNSGLCTSLPTSPSMNADWILVVSTTASEFSETQTYSEQKRNSTTEISSKQTKLDSNTVNLNETNVKASISFETRSVSSNSVSLSTSENNILLSTNRISEIINNKNLTTCDTESNNTKMKGLSEMKIINKSKENEVIALTHLSSRKKNRNKNIPNNFLASCKKYLSPEMAQLVKMHIFYKKRKLKEIKYQKFKKVAQKLNSISPKAYNYLAKTLKLPSINCLKNIS